MQGWVANTHADWFDFLSRRTHWDEVNFWTPSDYYAFHGAPGSPFFFRLKAPRNRIGGFGHVARFARLPDWLAWECFGEGNGAPDFRTMETRLVQIREQNDLKGRSSTGAPQIGCIILSDAVFFPESLWIRQPSDWGRQNLRYKGYDLTVGEGARVWAECQERAVLVQETSPYLPLVARDRQDRFGPPTLVAPRLGQGAFRVVVTDAYGRACAVTGEHSLPVLDAAHIKPFASDGPHDVRERPAVALGSAPALRQGLRDRDHGSPARSEPTAARRLQ
jgi:putative restriction endonuclease